MEKEKKRFVEKKHQIGYTNYRRNTSTFEKERKIRNI